MHPFLKKVDSSINYERFSLEKRIDLLIFNCRKLRMKERNNEGLHIIL